ncbi:unnamed protein product [Dicrocoelium dendriticum]|nr:unnamed protein product [Dicrocoelium dendriticum]
MAALYQIASNDAPCLVGGNWSDEFRDFVRCVLQKDPANRPFCEQALAHVFCTSVTRSLYILAELIQRTKVAVAAQENQLSQKWRKILYESDLNRFSESVLVTGCDSNVHNGVDGPYMGDRPMPDMNTASELDPKQKALAAEKAQEALSTYLQPVDSNRVGDYSKRTNTKRTTQNPSHIHDVNNHRSSGSTVDDLDFYTGDSCSNSVESVGSDLSDSLLNQSRQKTMLLDAKSSTPGPDAVDPRIRVIDPNSGRSGSCDFNDLHYPSTPNRPARTRFSATHTPPMSADLQRSPIPPQFASSDAHLYANVEISSTDDFTGSDPHVYHAIDVAYDFQQAVTDSNANSSSEPVPGVADSGPSSAELVSSTTGQFATLKTSQMMRGVAFSIDSSGRPSIGSPTTASAATLGFPHLAEGRASAFWRDQMSELKRLRTQHNKHLKQLLDKNNAEEEQLKSRLNREYEATKVAMKKEFQRLEEAHAAEMERERKRAFAVEAKLANQLDNETKLQLKSARKSRTRPVSAHDPPDAACGKEQDPVEATRRMRQNLTNLELRKAKRISLVQLQNLESEHIRQYIRLEQKAGEEMTALLLEQHLKLEELESAQQKRVHTLRLSQLQKQHEAEMNNHNQYIERAKVKLQNKHILEQKNLPKDLKQRELQIYKQFRDAARIQKKQFKLLRDERIKAFRRTMELSSAGTVSLGSTDSGVNASGSSANSYADRTEDQERPVSLFAPAQDERQILESLKQEEKRKQTDLEAQYKKTISDLYKRQNDKVDSTQTRELEELERHRKDGIAQLQNYQENQRREMVKQQQKEVEDLRNRIESRKDSLEAAVKKNIESTKEEARKKMRRLMEQHAQALRAFDAQTASLGIDNAAVIGVSGRTLGPSGGSSPGTSSGSFFSNNSSGAQHPADWRHSRTEFLPS